MTKHSDLFSDPEWFLAAFDAGKEQFSFIKTSLPTLLSAPFHDGRSNLSVDDTTRIVSLDQAVSWQRLQSKTESPNRVIIHISFCGSTLLTKALGLDNQNLAYCEPQALIDLANLKANRHTITQRGDLWNQVLNFSFGQFRKHWRQQRAAFVKPSNWANNIMPDALSAQSQSRCVLIDFDIESYLVANLRGGQGRLGYSLELLNHLAKQNTHCKSLAKNVESMPLTPIQRVLHLLAVTFNAQQQCLSAIAGNGDHVLRLSKEHLLESPEESLTKVANLLDIDFAGAHLMPDLDNLFKSNVKAEATLGFSQAEEHSQNTYIQQEFGADIAQVVQWYETITS